MDGTRILVADDDPWTVEMLVMLLELDGHAVQGAADGAEAWALMQSFRPQLLIVDARMPSLSGADVARRVRADARLADTRIIVLSGHDARDTAELELFDLHVAKPASAETLRAAVQQLLAAGRQGAVDATLRSNAIVDGAGDAG